MKVSSRNSISKLPRKLSSPDLTAFIDLGFLLTTFFMFSIYLAKPQMLSLNMPEKVDARNYYGGCCLCLKNEIIIILGKDNRIFWHQNDLHDLAESNLKETDYSENGIRKLIADTRRNSIDSSTLTVIIKPNSDSNFKNTVDVLDEMAISGIKRYAIVDISSEENIAYTKSITKGKIALK
jgi:biopolymer transport protein ExbD